MITQPLPSIPQLQRRLNELKEEKLPSGEKRYLFRGEKRKYQTIFPSFGRLDSDEILRGQAYTIYRAAPSFLSGLYGYRINGLQAVAILQHYGLFTPELDFTGNPEIALYFATENLYADDQPRIFVVDRMVAEQKHNLIVTNHDFFVTNDPVQLLNNRWWRQDGYAIMRKDWYMATSGEEFNLLDYTDMYECIEFNPGELNKIKYDVNYIYYNNDKLPKLVQEALNIFCARQFFDYNLGENVLHAKLADRISQIY